jgi:hypothetical protein
LDVSVVSCAECLGQRFANVLFGFIAVNVGVTEFDRGEYRINHRADKRIRNALRLFGLIVPT